MLEWWQGSVPQQFDVFLSYSSRDWAVVQRIAQRLKRAGVEPWVDRWSQTAGVEWQRELGAGLNAALSCAVFVGPQDLGAWELQEVAVALDRAAKQEGFRVFPVLLPGVEEPFDPNRLPHFLRMRTWVDFRGGGEDGRALQDLINAVRGVPFGPDVPMVGGDDAPPYRGLRVFDEEDARFFFGRDREIQRLLEKLKGSTFLAVLGPSGSGKSSLVRAGLVPALRAALADHDRWERLVLRPGAAPLTALAAQLAKLQSGQAMQATLDALARDSRTLHLAVELALADRPPSDRVLVIVDQLEELFTLCRDEAQRRQFFATLVDATAAAGGRTVVIVTMRADFYRYVRCAPYPEFAQLMSAQQMLVGPMDTDGLRQAIEQPARRVGLQLEEGLSDTILADVGAEPGALPLLEHALLELWERRRGGLLTLEGYRSAGGVHGALAQRADKIYDELHPDQQEIARRLLLRLTQPGEGTEDTRRRAIRTELSPATTSASFDDVLDRLVDARLLTTGRNETGQPVVDVSHEALIRWWPRLREWIDADRAGLLIHRRLTDAAREWNTLNHEPAALYRGGRLAAAREWASDHTDHLSELDNAFLKASQAAEHNELAAARRKTRRLRILTGGSIVLTALVAAVAVWALAERNQARAEATRATSLALASYAQANVGTRPIVALFLSLAALNPYRASSLAPAEARSSMIAALENSRPVRPLRAPARQIYNPVIGVVFDGPAIIYASQNNMLTLWNVATHKQIGPPLTVGHSGWLNSVAFSPDRQIVAAAGSDNTIRLWNVTTRTQIGQPLIGHTDDVLSLAFSRDGRTLASASADGTIRLWKTATQQQIARPLIIARNDMFTSVAFSPTDATTLASASADGTIRLWNVATHKQLGQRLATVPGWVSSVTFSPDGRTLASGDDDDMVRLWDVKTHKQVGHPLAGHTSGITSVAFSPDGHTLASLSQDGAVTLWDIATDAPQPLPPVAGNDSMSGSIAFSYDGGTLANAGNTQDGTVRLWDLPPVAKVGQRLASHTGNVNNLTFSPDANTLVSGGADGIRLWKVATGAELQPGIRTTESTIVAFSRDGRRLASADHDGPIRLWNVATQHEISQATTATTATNPLLPQDTRPTTAINPTFTGPVFPGSTSVTSLTSLAFSPDGGTLAFASDDGTIELWDVATQQEIGQPIPGDIPNPSLAFSADGARLASTGAGSTIRVWDVATQQEIGQPLSEPVTGPAPRPPAVTSVTLSPDGRTVASTDHDGTIRLWNVATGAEVQLGDPTSASTIVAFSPDGTLASADYHGTIKLWDVATRTQIGQPLTGNTAQVNRLAFSRDDRTLASASLDGTITLWSGFLWHDYHDLRTEVCGRTSTRLSAADWAQYAPGIKYQRDCVAR